MFDTVTNMLVISQQFLLFPVKAETAKGKCMYSNVNEWHSLRTDRTMLSHIQVGKEILHRQVYSSTRFV